MNKTTTKITIDGKQFAVDVNKAIEAGYLKPVVEHKAGNIYEHDCSGEYYILAFVDGYCLICLNDGSCWNSPVLPMSDDGKTITNGEWSYISSDEFEFVSEPLDFSAPIKLSKLKKA